jgi:rubrerythrin
MVGKWWKGYIKDMETALKQAKKWVCNKCKTVLGIGIGIPRRCPVCVKVS